MTIKDKHRIAEIINNGLKQCNWNFDIPNVLPDAISNLDFWYNKNLIGFEDGKNPLESIFSNLSRNRYKDFGQFHHYKRLDLALQIIQNKAIQVSDLFSNDGNDFAEYTEFYKRIGLYYQLLPKKFRDTKEGEMIDLGLETPADKVRKETFILCFAQDNHNERFWKDYARSDQGVAIGFRFSKFNEDPNTKLCYDLRDVFYDKGYSFDFLNEINYHLRKEFNKMLFAGGLVRFSRFYKRAKYDWENETRLCFDYDMDDLLGIGQRLNKVFQIQESRDGRKFINLPLKGNDINNPFFDLEITEIVCGKKVGNDDFRTLKEALSVSFPEATIWRRV